MIFGTRRSGVSSLMSRLMIGTAFSALAIGTAQAQDTAAALAPETVTVTGTSIRGAQPTGSPLITVGRPEIEASGFQTTVQLLTNIPQLNGFGGTGADAAGGDGFGPTIHSVGNQSSSATLALIDGHRIPSVGATEANSDPSLVPAAAMQRIEVLPDGASAVYGSDAVTGVVNFITRRDYEGVEAALQSGLANHYQTFNASVTGGESWNGGNVLVTYNYSGNSELPASARPGFNIRQDIYRGATNPSLFPGLATINNGALAVFPLPTTPPAAPTVNGNHSVTPADGPGIHSSVPGGTAIPYPSLVPNGANFNCPVATIAANGSSQAYLYQPGVGVGNYGGLPYNTATQSNAPSQGVCDYNLIGSDISSTTRNNMLVSVRQQLAPNLVADMEFVFGANVTASKGGDRGSIGATAYGPTMPLTAANGLTAGNINPFYQGNATTGTNSEFVRYDFTSLLGPTPVSKGFTQQYFVSGGLAWDLGGDREITLGGVAGNGYVFSRSVGISAANANLALNGTPLTTGVPNAATLALSGSTDIFGLGTTSETQRVLTTLNALDVWDPAGPTNKTSAAVIASIQDGGGNANTSQDTQDFILKFDGPVFDLPAGPLKMAAGGEFMHRTYIEWGSSDATTGPSRSNAKSYYYDNGRQVYSAFLEFNAPIISPEMNIPGVSSVTVDLSGRFDDYNDVGTTYNPKIGLDWVITEGLKARVSWGTSFVAANVHDNAAINSQSGVSGSNNTPGSPSAVNNIIPFNSALPFSNQNGLGAGIAGTWVSTAASCTQGGGVPSDANGLASSVSGLPAVGCKVTFNATSSSSTASFAIGVSGANPTLKPTTGRSANVGLDINAGKFWNMLDGLTASVGYWELADRGAITNQQVTNNIPSDVTFAPIGGWTQTSPYIVNFVSGRPINVALGQTIWATTDTRLQNAYNVWENGIDFNVDYSFATDSYGTFRAGVTGSTVLRFTQQGGNIGPLFDVLDGKNAPRFNTADMKGRLTLGWNMDGFNFGFGMNYVHPEHGTSSTFPYNLAGSGISRGAQIGAIGATSFISAGITEVPALLNFDINASYVIPQGLFGMPDVVTSGTSVSLNVNNLLDTGLVYSPGGGSTSPGEIGRLISLSLKKKF